MAATPAWKVYTADGEYVAACHYVEDAAAIVALRGDGATIRNGHARSCIVWTEGRESQPAAESYDFVTQTAYERRDNNNKVGPKPRRSIS